MRPAASPSDPGGGAWAGRPIWLVALAVATAGAFVARLLAARGELWVDEIWTLTLVAPLAHAIEALWRIAHDNNHFLNSIWMAALGPDAPPVALRALSAAESAACIVVAAHIGARRSVATALAAAALFALAEPLARHGSEARGYAGLALASLLAIDVWLAAMARPERGALRWLLGAAALFGALSHLTFAMTMAVLGLASVWMWRRDGQSPGAITTRAIALYLPAALAMGVVLALLMAGIRAAGGFTIGGVDAFTLAGFFRGFGGLVVRLAGLGETGDGVTVVAALAVWGLLLLGLPAVRPALRAPVVIAGLVLPLALLALHPPNLAYSRYFLVPGVFLLVGAADMLGAGFSRGGAARWLAAALLGAVLIGNAWSQRPLYALTTPTRADMVARVAASARPLYASNEDFRIPMILGFHARHGGAPTLVPEAGLCEARPDWFIAELGGNSVPPERIQVGPQACRAPFALVEAQNAAGHLATRWALYRRL